MKKLESLMDSRFQRMGTAELSRINGGYANYAAAGTDLDSFVCTASNPNEGDGVECDPNCDASGVAMSNQIFEHMVASGNVEPKEIAPGHYLAAADYSTLLTVKFQG